MMMLVGGFAWCIVNGTNAKRVEVHHVAKIRNYIHIVIIIYIRFAIHITNQLLGKAG